MRSNRLFILPDYLFSAKGKLYKGKPVPPLKDVLNDICFREAFFGKEKQPGYNLYLPKDKQLEFYEKYGEFGVRSHYRWQACGPGWQDHKLVYIDQQIRNKDN